MPPINANPCGPVNLTADQIETAFCNALTNCLPQPLQVTADAALTALLESIADDIVAQVALTEDNLENSLEDITVTVDTTAGPVEITGTVNIGDPVVIDWTGIQGALDGLDVEVTNYADLVALLTDPATTLTIDGTVTAVLDATQFAILETLLETIDQTLKATVRKDWEVMDLCIVDAEGLSVPLVGVFTERGYDYLGNQSSETVVYSQFDPAGPAWTAYALQAGDTVVDCSRQTQNTVLMMEGCMADPVTGDAIQGYVGVNSLDGTLAWGPLSKGDLGFISCCVEEETAETGFTIDPAWQDESTKFNLDDPLGTDAYGSVDAPWTTVDLVVALNASAANAPAPYTTTIFQSTGDVITVLSGPTPSSLDLVSIGISIPLLPI